MRVLISFGAVREVNVAKDEKFFENLSRIFFSSFLKIFLSLYEVMGFMCFNIYVCVFVHDNQTSLCQE